MRISELLKHSTARLKEQGVDTPRLDAEILLAELLGRDRVWLLIHDQDEISADDLKKYEQMIDRRCAHEPVAYIIGHREFMGLDLRVDENVLIPRPDTECIVEAVFELIENRSDSVRVLDLCTGSGAIGLSVKKYYPKTEVVLSDISASALSVAEKNAETFKLPVTLIQSDLFEKINDRFDIIVSNPPYIPSAEISRLMADVQSYEPHSALDGGSTGLFFYQSIINDAARYLTPGGYLVFECGHDQGETIAELMRNQDFNVNIMKKDLAGILRCVGGRQL